MITDSAISMFLTVASFLCHLFPSFGDPSTATAPLADGLLFLSPYLTSTGNWLPWSSAFGALAVATGALAVGLGVKIVRILASFATVGGGSAG